MSARIDFRGPYMGFTYNGVHSSTLGIVRVSDGSRFNENLLPTMQDKTVQVPGGDGTYYFGSYYTQRQFNVSFAFDDLTEQEVAELKRHFGDKGIHNLIFDETPYKVYSAKVTGTATIKYIPFAEGENERLYKGEGNIQFTCYYPFARCYSTSKEDYKRHPAYLIKEEDGTFHLCEDFDERVAEWWDVSNINKGGNFGDIPVSFEKEISESDEIKFSDKKYISWEIPAGKTATLNTKIGIAKDGSGTIYNQYIDGDITLKIPVGATKEQTQDLTFTCEYI